MRVGMLAPISHHFPPGGYGPWEQVAHDLTEGLVERGHDVVLFAPHGSSTRAVLSPTVPSSLDESPDADPRVSEELHVATALRAAVDAGLDLVHSHLHVHALGFAPFMTMPLVSTLHGAAWHRPHHAMLRAFRDQPFVSLSDAERRFMPELNYVATVGNGIRVDDFAVGRGGDRLAFVGRMAPEKAPDLAIRVARQAGRDLVLVGAVEERHADYFAAKVVPLLSKGVEYAGSLTRPEAIAVMSMSAALLMPLRWDEPFGLVVVESLAVGTPVVAWRRGAMLELIQPGTTGFVVDGVRAAVEAVAEIEVLDRSTCREEARRRFSHLAMADGYLAAYSAAIAGGPG